jgi:hypothetical protein
MIKKAWVTHVNATCEDCGAEFMNYKNGQALAAKHAKKYSHLVRGEVALAFEYDGRQKDSQNRLGLPDAVVN